jgi:hypothetical protein
MTPSPSALTTTDTTASAPAKQELFPYTIEGASCEHCGETLAWRRGVSRPVVLTHAGGKDTCRAPLASLREADIPLAQEAIDTAAFLMELGRNAPNT